MPTPLTWTKMKLAVADQMLSDPQRATLSTRAWQGVEAGLQHLAGVGYGFEIAPRGTLAQLAEERQLPLPLSIADAKAKVAPALNAQTSKFDAMTAAASKQ